MKALSRYLDMTMKVLTVALLVVLTVIVLMGVSFRYFGGSLIWYDEVASMLLAWITFLGAALAMNSNAHMGFSGILFSMAMPARRIVFILNEIVVLASAGVIAWASWSVMSYFAGETLVSVRWMPRSVVQGVLPVSFVLMIISRLLSVHERWQETRLGLDAEAKEIQAEIARAQSNEALMKGTHRD